MARLVALFIEDNDQAQTLIDDLRDYPNIGKLLTPVQENEVVAIPLALFAVPVSFCECPERFQDSKVSGYKITRGSSLGWWIHNKEGCYKPRLDGWQSPKNLIKVEDEHTRVHVSWTFKPPLHHVAKFFNENKSTMGAS